MTPLDIALGYIERGWRVVPIPFKAKGPVIPDWQNLEITAANAAEYFDGDPQNIGTLLGAPSGDLADIDLDWPEAERLARYFLFPTDCTFGRASKPESHYFYRAKGAITFKFQLTGEKGGTVLEIRSTGVQTVLPGSIHPSGEAVEFVRNGEVGVVEPDRLRRAAGLLAGGCVLLRAWAPGVKDDLATAAAGVLLRGGWEPERVDRFIEIISTEAGDHSTRDKLKAERLASALQSKQGHVPGLPRLKELMGELAAAKFVEWMGLKLATETEPFPLEAVYTLEAFAAAEFPPLVFTIDGFMYAPSISMIFGPRGGGKTWVAMTLAVSLASGQPFLFWPVVKPQRCLYVDGEMPSAMLQARFAQLTRDTSIPIQILGNEVLFRMTGETFCINNILHQQRFIATLQALQDAGRGVDHIYFDNLSALTFGGDENDNSAQDSVIFFLLSLRLQGYSVTFLHHAGKNGEQRGASRREDLLDLVVKMSAPTVASGHQGAAFKYEISKSRGFKPMPETGEAKLVVGPDGLLEWAMTDGNGLEQNTARRILQYIASSKPEKAADIAAAFNIKPPTVTYHLGNLRKKGLVQSGQLRVTEAGRGHLEKALMGDYDAPDF